MIDKTTAEDIRERDKRFEEWLVTNGYRKKHGWASWPTTMTPKWAPTDEERSALEVFDFVNDPQERYFAYIVNGKVTTWMEETLATVTNWGREYECPAWGDRGSRRRNFRAVGIDGREWYGTYYVSSGTYCRMRARKTKQRALNLDAIR